jgi:hypothetical protein
MLKKLLRSTTAASLVLAAFLALASGCVERGRIYARFGPPAPIVETRVIAPGPDYIWISGYHRWDGGSYVWVPGRWELPPRHNAHWVEGRWERDNRGWYWVQGHWR